jgi:hypothetical protein
MWEGLTDYGSPRLERQHACSKANSEAPRG